MKELNGFLFFILSSAISFLCASEVSFAAPSSLPPPKVIVLNEITAQNKNSETFFGTHQKNLLQEVVDFLKKNPNYTLSISGHVSASDDDESDKKTADEIAYFAKTYLLENGVSKKRFDPNKSFGSSKPLAHAEKQAAENNRIEISFDTW